MTKYLLLLLLASTSFAHRLNYYPGGPLKIITIGHPTLQMVAQEVPYEEINSSEIQNLIDQMISTMKSASGVGLAAPQVNVSKRLFVMKPSIFECAEAVINPLVEYNSHSGTKQSIEGCLSIPGRKFTVKRYNNISASYFNRNGVMISDFGLEGFISSDEIRSDNIPMT